ncbi:MAG: hypothetical protein ACLPIX_16245 [Rhodomicrobium sp.]
MRIGGRLFTGIAVLAILAMPLSAGTAGAKTRKVYHRHFATARSGCPVHRNGEGELIDCRGWRLRSNAIGWDNTCFHLDYLPSMYACGSTGGGW